MECQYFLTESQQKLVEENVGLVGFAINKYLSSIPLDYEDMISIGNYALCKAAARFNTTKNHTFSTYAIKVICRTIQREILYATRQKRGGTTQTISLNQSNWCNNEGEELIDMIVDSNIDVELDAINKAICSNLWDMVPTYVGMEANGMNCKEYAEFLGLSRNTISDRKKREFEAARKYLFSKGFIQSA